jgi:hypothetical protein
LYVAAAVVAVVALTVPVLTRHPAAAAVAVHTFKGFFQYRN